MPLTLSTAYHNLLVPQLQELEVDRQAMCAAADHLRTVLDTVIEEADSVWQLSAAANSLRCSHMDAALVELEASLKQAAPEWMVLCLLLGLQAVLVLLDAVHAVHLANLSRGLSRRTARPIYWEQRKRQRHGGADGGLEFGKEQTDNGAKEPRRDGSSTTRDAAVTDGEGGSGAKESATRKLGRRSKSGSEGKSVSPSAQARSTKRLAPAIASDFRESLFLDESRFQAGSEAGVGSSEAWNSQAAFSRVAGMQQVISYDEALLRRPVRRVTQP